MGRIRTTRYQVHDTIYDTIVNKLLKSNAFANYAYAEGLVCPCTRQSRRSNSSAMTLQYAMYTVQNSGI